MAEDEYISCELSEILTEFQRIRNAYFALQAYCEGQEEMLTIEKERSEKMKGNLELLSKTYFLLDGRYKSLVKELTAEKDALCKTVEELKEQCDHLRLINFDKNQNCEQTCRLEDEVEVLKAQLLLEKEKHDEDIALLKQQHSDEIQRLKVLLENAKMGLTSVHSKKRGRPKKLTDSKNNSVFRWPKLGIQKIIETTTQEETMEGKENGNKNKKRKLFHEDKEAYVDIV